MKTFLRVLMILAAFACVMGLAYLVVNLNSSSNPTTASAFENRSVEFAQNGTRPEFDREGAGGGGAWIFGLIKNIVVVAVIVVSIVLPKNLLLSRRREVHAGVR